MINRAPSPVLLIALAAALALSGCGRDDANQAAATENNATDAALASALEDQIMVDPKLAQSNQGGPAQPAAAAGAGTQQPGAATGQATGAAPQPQPASAAPAGGGTGCIDPDRFEYGPSWSNRLSPDFPLYPGAQVAEAAGNEKDNCHTRVVTFTTGDNFQRVLDWYNTKAVRAGYSSEQQIKSGDRVLAGANEAGGGAYYLIVTPKPSGAEVALITNNGR